MSKLEQLMWHGYLKCCMKRKKDFHLQAQMRRKMVMLFIRGKKMKFLTSNIGASFCLFFILCLTAFILILATFIFCIKLLHAFKVVKPNVSCSLCW
ncbi:unnamed protein product [Thelazia callipaeda]|uniref:Ovule protein n=1 Tax=Thelazia callipaeda TaxID=103827 RepID=A0A0N5DAU4_THECL|nr:unnamed protein product [Thelazia callipaeda]